MPAVAARRWVNVSAVTSLKFMLQRRPSSEFQNSSDERKRSPCPLKTRFIRGMYTLIRGMPPAMMWAKRTFAPAGISFSASAAKAARAAVKRATPRCRDCSMLRQLSRTWFQVSGFALLSWSAGDVPSSSGSRSKPASSGTLMILPPRSASASDSSADVRGRSFPSLARRPTVAPTTVIPRARASSTMPLA